MILSLMSIITKLHKEFNIASLMILNVIAMRVENFEVYKFSWIL